LATQLLVRINDTFALELPLATLFERPSLAALAEATVDAQLATLATGAESVAVDADALDRYARLSDEELERLLQTETP